MPTALATLLGNLYLVLGSFFWGGLATLFGWLPPRGNFMFFCARSWGKGLLRVCGAPARARFEAELDPRARYVFMANHESLFDIPAMLATLPGQTRFLAKRSLFRIPIFGWALSVGGFIPVDRENRATARDTFNAAVDRLEAGTSILIFPEETRSDGRALLPFQRGGFLLALKRGLPIVPVGVRGTREVQRPQSFAIRPGPIDVRYGAPLSAAAFGVRRKGELMAAVRAEVARLADTAATAAVG